MAYYCPECGELTVEFRCDTGVYIAHEIWASTYRCSNCGLEFLMDPDYHTEEDE